MRIDARESSPAIRAADQNWLVAFLKHGGDRIALTPLDTAILRRARHHSRT